MTNRLGVLEWMDDTTTLKDFLKEAATDQDNKAWSEVRNVTVDCLVSKCLN